MKLIIDIPENIYKRTIEESTFNVSAMINAIRYGIPLNSVKAEIVKAYDEVTMYSCDEEVSRFASIVCGILNNIGKESEAKKNDP